MILHRYIIALVEHRPLDWQHSVNALLRHAAYKVISASFAA